MGASPGCFRVCVCDHFDDNCIVGGIRGEDTKRGPMDDDGGVVCDLFWKRFSSGTNGVVLLARVQEADKVRRGEAVGIDG